jgi:hypothetical protein
MGPRRAPYATSRLQRIPDETIAYWEAALEGADADALIRTEVELWSFTSTQHQRDTSVRFEAAVADAAGTIVDRASIPEIGYEGVLIDLPAAEVQRSARREEVRLAICDEVMFLRPQLTAEFPTGVEPVEAGATPEATPAAAAAPIAALFDGVPVQGHRLLNGRLILDDPDDLDALSIVAERRHGTEMASLILHESAACLLSQGQTGDNPEGFRRLDRRRAGNKPALRQIGATRFPFLCPVRRGKGGDFD